MTVVKYLLVSLIVIMSFVGNSYGQCAWVLWERTIFLRMNPPQEKWKLIEAYPTREECLQSAEKTCRDWFFVLSRGNKTGEKVERVDSYSYIISTENFSVGIKFMCFPDSIDPRK